MTNSYQNLNLKIPKPQGMKSKKDLILGNMNIQDIIDTLLYDGEEPMDICLKLSHFGDTKEEIYLKIVKTITSKIRVSNSIDPDKSEEYSKGLNRITTLFFKRYGLSLCVKITPFESLLICLAKNSNFKLLAYIIHYEFYKIGPARYLKKHRDGEMNTIMHLAVECDSYSFIHYLLVHLYKRIIKCSQDNTKEYVTQSELFYKILSEGNKWQESCLQIGESVDLGYKDVSMYMKVLRRTLITKRRLLYNPREPQTPKSSCSKMVGRYENYASNIPVEKFQKIESRAERTTFDYQPRSEYSNFSVTLPRRGGTVHTYDVHRRKGQSMINSLLPSKISQKEKTKNGMVRSISRETRVSTEVSQIRNTNKKTIKSLMMMSNKSHYFGSKLSSSQSHNKVRDIRFLRNKSLNHWKIHASIVNPNELPFYKQVLSFHILALSKQSQSDLIPSKELPI
ncbi:unnamed protein product [Moneuplotes crassus]|uniref:Uncharacterized protein n=1 Tax=Euplotes crassus TaxID=5936 RepID=A0AAD1U314_EUPCR|nr:unnamed protein product [Moneuplotes crassus]